MNSILNHLRNNWILILLLILSAFLRIYQLDSYPKPANQDELNNIYDSYSILKTHADRWNRPYPILLRGFGNEGYPTSLYSWMSIPFLKIANEPNLFWGRFLSAILGVMSILIAYLYCKDTFDRKTALIAVLLICFSPWHILYSRVGIESSILPAFFIILIMYLWNRMRINLYSIPSIIVLGITIGLSTNAYTASRITALLFSVIIFFELISRMNQLNFKKIIVLTLSVAIGASTQLFAFFKENELFMERGKGVLISFLPVEEFIQKFLSNIFKNLDYNYLFFEFPLHNNISIGRFFPFLFPLFLIGILILIIELYRNRFGKYNILIISLIISVIPAALTHNNPIAIRSSGMSIIIPILCSISFPFLFDLIPKLKFTVVFPLLFIINSIWFIHYFQIFKQNEGLQDPDKQHLLYLNAIKLNEYGIKDELLLIDYFGNQPYIYYLFFNKINPERFQSSIKVLNTNENFDYVYRMDNYFFINVVEFHERNKHKLSYNKSKKYYISYNRKINDLKYLGNTIWMSDTCYFYTNK